MPKKYLIASLAVIIILAVSLPDKATAMDGQVQPPNSSKSVNFKISDIADLFNFDISWGGTNKASHIDTGYSEQEVLQIARDSYVYALPLVIMDLTTKNLTNVSESGGSPINQFNHSRKTATADDRFVVRPNIDTPYSSACLELSSEPLVFSKPKTDRYCSIAIYDAYTNCVAVLGTGGIDNGEEATYLLCGPDYSGTVPEGLVKVSIPTNMAWMLVRTEYIDENDLPNVYGIQDKLSLVPLSQAENTGYEPPKGSYDSENSFVPFHKIKSMDIEEFFNTFNRLAASNPGTVYDDPALQRFAEIGVGPGLDFTLSAFPEQTQKVLKDYPDTIIAELLDSVQNDSTRFSQFVNNWKYFNNNIARFGTDYDFRAIVALTGLGANPVEMAVYPSTSVDSDGQPLNGENNYIMRFENEDFPPCDAFWSITSYDKDGFLIQNPINKYAIRDKDDFVINEDGSVDIYIQAESPGEKLQENWIPVPKDYFQLTLRIYLPDKEVLDLYWKPPVIVKKQ